MFNNFKIPLLASSSPLEITPKLNLLGGVITKTVTYHPIEGKPEQFEIFDSGCTWNNQGLPNLGIHEFSKITLNKYRQVLDDDTKLIVSIMPLTPKEAKEMLNILLYNADIIQGIEFNISCPNYMHKYNLSEIESILATFKSKWVKFFSVKIPIDISDIELELINEYSIEYLNCFNTIPARKIYWALEGSIGGKLLKDFYPLRIEEIKQWYPHIKIIGTGGIENMNDLNIYKKSGAELFGIRSYFLKSSNNIERLVTEFVNSELDEQIN